MPTHLSTTASPRTSNDSAVPVSSPDAGPDNTVLEYLEANRQPSGE